MLVFVHGLSGTWQNWLLNIPAFMDSHRVIALDLPGFGESPMPREKISIQGYARILDGLLEQLGVESAAVVGNSMGGFVAAELALSFSTRVRAARARRAPPGSRSRSTGGAPLLVGARVVGAPAPRGSAPAGTRWSRARVPGGSGCS